MQFWQKLEEEMQTQFPTYLKNLLYSSGYDNRMSLSNISDEAVESIEKFAREGLLQYLIDSGLDNNLHDYYGKFFAKNVKMFQILPGHRELLKRLAKYCAKSKFSLSSGKATSREPKKAEVSQSNDSGTKSVEEETDLNKLEEALIRTIKIYVLKTFANAKVALSKNDDNKLQNLVAPVKRCMSSSGKFDYEAKVECICCAKPLSTFRSSGSWIISNYSRHISRQHLKTVSNSNDEMSIPAAFPKTNLDVNHGVADTETAQAIIIRHDNNESHEEYSVTNASKRRKINSLYR